MKKIIVLALIVLFISLGAFVLIPLTARAEVSPEVENFLQKSTQGENSQSEVIDSHKDYLSKEQKVNSAKTVRQNNGPELEYGPIQENVLYKNIILSVYSGMRNNKKAYIIRAFLRDEKNNGKFNLVNKFFICYQENHVKDLENRFFGKDPEEKQKFIEQLAKNFLATIRPTPTPPQIKSSP